LRKTVFRDGVGDGFRAGRLVPGPVPVLARVVLCELVLKISNFLTLFYHFKNLLFFVFLIYVWYKYAM
jgi:hypothetical protein